MVGGSTKRAPWTAQVAAAVRLVHSRPRLGLKFEAGRASEIAIRASLCDLSA